MQGEAPSLAPAVQSTNSLKHFACAAVGHLFKLERLSSCVLFISPCSSAACSMQHYSPFKTHIVISIVTSL